MKRLLILTGWCLAIASTWAPPAAAADQFAQHLALELESGAAFYSVPLSAAVYAASQRDDLGDVRRIRSIRRASRRACAPRCDRCGGFRCRRPRMAVRAHRSV